VVSTYLERRKKLLAELPNHPFMLLVTNPKNVYYLTGFFSDPHERFMGLLWHENVGWTLILPKLDVQAASLVLDSSLTIVGFGDDEPAQQKVGDWMKQAEAEEVWLEESLLSYERVKWLLQYKPKIRIHNIIPALNKMRVIKTAEEISLLKEAGLKTDLVLKEAFNRFQLGMSENDLVAEIEFQAKKAGAEQMAFGTSVLSAEKSALPHGNPASQLLKQGVILIDYGMVINGYCSDMTRTFHIGPWEEKMRKIYDTVLQAEKEAIQQVKIGMTFAEVDAIARGLIDQAGYGEYFIHRLGHGMGLDVHEYPSLGAGNNERVEAGMVFTIEPGVYVPDLGGVRIEDAVVMEPDGAQTLTHFPKEAHEVIL
jgi:Xaa-Pro dipeptidase